MPDILSDKHTVVLFSSTLDNNRWSPQLMQIVLLLISTTFSVWAWRRVEFNECCLQAGAAPVLLAPYPGGPRECHHHEGKDQALPAVQGLCSSAAAYASRLHWKGKRKAAWGLILFFLPTEPACLSHGWWGGAGASCQWSLSFRGPRFFSLWQQHPLGLPGWAARCCLQAGVVPAHLGSSRGHHDYRRKDQGSL